MHVTLFSLRNIGDLIFHYVRFYYQIVVNVKLFLKVSSMLEQIRLSYKISYQASASVTELALKLIFLLVA